LTVTQTSSYVHGIVSQKKKLCSWNLSE